MSVTLFDLHATITQLEDDLGATPDLLADALGVNPRTLQRWHDGDTLPQPDSRVRLQTLAGLRDRLHETFMTTEAARAWMRHPHRMLGGLTPLDAIRVGRIDAVTRARGARLRYLRVAACRFRRAGPRPLLATGAEGLLVPSATLLPDPILVIFPDALRPDSRVVPLESIDPALSRAGP